MGGLGGVSLVQVGSVVTARSPDCQGLQAGERERQCEGKARPADVVDEVSSIYLKTCMDCHLELHGLPAAGTWQRFHVSWSLTNAA